jgi:hypothetical protein
MERSPEVGLGHANFPTTSSGFWLLVFVRDVVLVFKPSTCLAVL